MRFYLNILTRILSPGNSQNDLGQMLKRLVRKSHNVILALGYGYTMRFIGCDSIATCSLVSGRFRSHTMIYREFKRIGQTNRTV